MDNFWQSLQKPVFSLAPMEDVTDTAFRELVALISDPNYLQVVFTEFTSVDGMNHPIGRKRVAERLVVSSSERKILREKGIKIVAQIWGSNPETFFSVSKYISEHYDFDGLDINMGCPVKKIVKTGGCSALIGQNQLAHEIIKATQEGSGMLVSVKTRTGIKEHQTESWIENLLKANPAAICLHGRTQKMMSEYEADWSEIAKAIEVRDSTNPNIPIYGNGDLFNMETALQKIAESGADGAMIGRGIFHDPWFFDIEKTEVSEKEKIDLLLLHTKKFEENWKGIRNFNTLKRFYKIYINGFHGASALRAKLMECKDYHDVYSLLGK